MGINVRNFYKNREAQKDIDFEQHTGFRIRKQIQAHDECPDSDKTEVFVLRTRSGKDFYGCQFGETIFYVVPIGQGKALMLIYDRFMLVILQQLMEWNHVQLSAFYKYAPTLMQAIEDGVHGNYSNFCLFEDDGMACLGIAIPFSECQLANIEEDQYLMMSYLDLLDFRLQCSEEIASFDGFSKIDKSKIVLNDAVAAVGKLLKELGISTLQNQLLP